MFGFNKKNAAKEAEALLQVSSMSSVEVYEKAVDKVCEQFEEEEQWIWVPGYKATDFYMRCKNEFQFEIGKVFSLPEDQEPEMCERGFHFCPKAGYVRQYYNYGRLFKVRALIKKSDWLKAEKWVALNNSDDYFRYHRFPGETDYSKLVAKSIEFIEEVPWDEAMKHFMWADYVETEEDWYEFLKFRADNKGNNDAWYYIKYTALMDKYNVSPILAQIFWDRFKYKHNAHTIAKLAAGLREAEVSNDMFVYLLTQEVNKLVAKE